LGVQVAHHDARRATSNAVPHSIAIDSKGRVYAADRENNRIKIFTPNGEFSKQWINLGCTQGVFITPDDKVEPSSGVTVSPDGNHVLTQRGGIGIEARQKGDEGIVFRPLLRVPPKRLASYSGIPMPISAPLARSAVAWTWSVP
jgi:sugar lactone lactonase YvrE